MSSYTAPKGHSLWVKKLGQCHLQAHHAPTTLCGMPMLGNHYSTHPFMVKCPECWAKAGFPVPPTKHVWVEVRATEIQRYLVEVPSDMMEGTIQEQFVEQHIDGAIPTERFQKDEEIFVDPEDPTTEELEKFPDNKRYEIEREDANAQG
jgi:hypothetical protein